MRCSECILRKKEKLRIKTTPEDAGESGIGRMFGAISLIGVGAVAGLLIISAKITIPLDGKDAKAKRQSLRDKLKTRN